MADNHNYYLASGTLVSNCATDEEHLQHTLRLFIFLNRHGPAFQHFRGKVDPERWHLEFYEQIPYDPQAAEEERENNRGVRRRRRHDRPVPAELLESG